MMLKFSTLTTLFQTASIDLSQGEKLVISVYIWRVHVFHCDGTFGCHVCLLVVVKLPYMELSLKIRYVKYVT